MKINIDRTWLYTSTICEVDRDRLRFLGRPFWALARVHGVLTRDIDKLDLFVLGAVHARERQLEARNLRLLTVSGQYVASVFRYRKTT